MTLRISIQDERALRALARAPEIVHRNLSQGVGRAGQETARTEKGSAPKAHSTLANSILSQRAGDLGADVAPGVEYAPYVNNGTQGGGWPPIATLREWIRVKGIQPQEPGMDERDLAYAIATKIQRQGTPPQPFADETAKAMGPRVEEILRTSAAAGLREAGLA